MIQIDFKEKFILINQMNWIKGINNFTSSAGLTFEKLLGKEADSLFFPDYYGLEIKTTTRFSRFPFSLFSLAFDGPNLYETNRILQKYGKTDYIYKDKKTLIGHIYTNKPVKLTDYLFKLSVDKTEHKLFLMIFDKNHNLLEKEAYISFDTIIERIKLKLSNLVVIYASKKKIDNNLFFRYYAYKRYILKSNVDLISLIEDNTIKIQLMCRISRSGADSGSQRNKSLTFRIEKKDIDKMFDCVENYNADIEKYENYNINA